MVQRARERSQEFEGGKGEGFCAGGSSGVFQKT